jgi:hypothetical protein
MRSSMAAGAVAGPGDAARRGHVDEQGQLPLPRGLHRGSPVKGTSRCCTHRTRWWCGAGVWPAQPNAWVPQEVRNNLPVVREARINLVDLAGSERQKLSQVYIPRSTMLLTTPWVWSLA